MWTATETVAIDDTANSKLPQYRDHSRHWRDNHYVYPVISRRSGGLSIGVNLNPDTVCNFDCIYCQVDRSGTPGVRRVDLDRLRDELGALLACAMDGSLFDDPAFAGVPDGKRAINDIAFSGDGEPTTCKVFPEAIELAAALKGQAGLTDTKILLITDACFLTRPRVVAGLAVMDAHNGEIWAKLDAGTESYFQKVSRSNVTLAHVIENIVTAAKVRPIVIQSLFMRIDGAPPTEDELDAYTDRLVDITRAGGAIKLVQVYTVARRPAESVVTPLRDEEVDRIAELVRTRTDLHVEPFYGVG